jgi:hypothetical protein
MKLRSVGTSPVVLVSSQDNPWNITLAPPSVYWASSLDGAVKSAPLDGGAVTTVVSGQKQVTGIAVDENNVYWTNFDGGTVMKAPLGGAVMKLTPK